MQTTSTAPLASAGASDRFMNFRILGTLVFAMLPLAAHAQSTPNFSYGQVPTAGMWNGAFASKQDLLGFVPLNRAGGTMLGRLTMAPSTVNGAGLNLPPGVAPGLPNNGDLWTTTVGLFARINNITVGPFAVAAYLVQGRLTLASATPVMTAAASAAGTTYYTPYTGNLAPVWNGSAYVATVFAEYGQALTDTIYSPSAAVAGACYDDFLWNSAGTVRATHGPAWTAGATAGSNTARGTGVGSTALTRQNGLLVNTVAILNGPAAGYGTYVGTFCTDAGAATVTFNPGGAGIGGVAAVVGLWNTFNRVATGGIVSDTTSSWSYATTGTWRPANASATARLTYVAGLPEDPWSADYSAFQQASTTGYSLAGIGLDTTSAPSGIQCFFSNGTAASMPVCHMAAPGLIGPAFHVGHRVHLCRDHDGLRLERRSIRHVLGGKVLMVDAAALTAAVAALWRACPAWIRSHSCSRARTAGTLTMSLVQ